MKNRHALAACVLLCLYGAIGLAQTTYPSTRFRNYSGQQPQGDDWATSPPSVPDLSPDSTDYHSMSPDSWSQPSQRTPQPALLPPAEPPIEPPADSGDNGFVPDDSGQTKQTERAGKSPFQSSAFSKTAVPEKDGQSEFLFDNVPAPSQPRTTYPLGDESISTLPVQESTGDFRLDTVQTPLEYDVDGYSSESIVPYAPDYRPDLGHRAPLQTTRSYGADDRGQTYEFECREHPSLKTILATGRFFGSATLLDMKPAFQSNTAISVEGPSVAESRAFDFDHGAAPHFRFGFESCYGPGVEFEYWQYGQTSSAASFTSNGQQTGTSSTWMLGASGWSRLIAANAGEQLASQHTLDIESFGVSFFKEMKFKVSRLTGTLGYRNTRVTQGLNSVLSSGGAEIGSLISRSDLNAWGPEFALEYYRPIGHTRLEFLTTFGGSAMFGGRDQFVSNTATGEFDRLESDDFVTTIDFLAGVQYKKMTAENRSVYARLGLNYQTWIGGGTAVNPEGNFGLRGFSFGVGYNR